MVETLLVSNVLLWIVVVVMGLMIFALVRQVGVLYERVAPAGALMLNNRLRVGSAAPRLEVQDLDGNRYTIGAPSTDGKSMLLFFVSPTCPVCKTLLPVIKSASRSEHSWLDIILASDGGEYDHRRYIAEHGLKGYVYVSSQLLGTSYGVGKLPFAVLIDEQGRIASMGIVNSREHLESLFESKERGVASIQDYMKEKSGTDHGFPG